MMNLLVFGLIGLGLFFSILRLIIGPDITDRIVSVDAINVIVTGTIVFIAHIFKSNLYLDIAIAYAALSFLETVIFARYLEAKK